MIGEEREHDRTCASDPQDERVVLIRMSRFEELLPFGSGRTGFAVCSLFVIILVGRAKGRSASRCNEELTAASRVVFFKSRTRFDRDQGVGWVTLWDSNPRGVEPCAKRRLSLIHTS